MPEHESLVGSLRAFKLLEKLEIKLSLLMRHRHGEWEGPRLVDVMPALLEKQFIADHKVPEQSAKVIVGLFVGLSELKKERLPKLKVIAFTYFKGDLEEELSLPVEKETIAVCEKEGIILGMREVTLVPVRYFGHTWKDEEVGFAHDGHDKRHGHTSENENV